MAACEWLQSEAMRWLCAIALLLPARGLAQRAEIPEFVHGDECLFCHRAGIGSTWQKNRHGVTLRERADAPDLVERLKPPPELTHFLGSRNHVRFLKKDGYNNFDIMEPGGHWDKTKFGERCAGCHTTAVDSKTRQFAYIGLDCYTCHAVVDLNHSADTSLIWLSKKRRGDLHEITATCAQCHLRGVAKSRSTGLPYPNNFVVGDDLFRDYEVDFSKLDALNPGDRHVVQRGRRAQGRLRRDLPELPPHPRLVNSKAPFRADRRSLPRLPQRARAEEGCQALHCPQRAVRILGGISPQGLMQVDLLWRKDGARTTR